MKNIMDEYIKFTKKNIKSYMKMVFNTHYNAEIVDEFLKTYINSRYYNINDNSKKGRPFYLKILDELNEKAQILKTRFSRDDYQLIDNLSQAFYYVLFFDSVRKVENLKSMSSIKEVVKKLSEIREKEFNVRSKPQFEDEFCRLISSDMLKKDIYLENFLDDKFILDIKKSNDDDNIYFTNLEYDIKLPMQFSQIAIDSVYNEGIIAEDRLEIEFILLSVVVIRDIVDGDFKDVYVTKFPSTLFKKRQKMKTLLETIENQALQEKINLNITYEEYNNHKTQVQRLINEGFQFVITLDNTLKHTEDIEKLKMFNTIVLPKNLHLYKEIKKHKVKLANKIIEE